MMLYIKCEDCGQEDLIDEYDYRNVGCKCNDCIEKEYKRRQAERARREADEDQIENGVCK